MDIKLTWVANKGFTDGEIEVFYGASRTVLRQILTAHYGEPKSFRSDEDDYADSQIRLRFDSAETLQDIEIMGGQVQHDGLELFATTFTILDEAIAVRYKREPMWNDMMGWAECPELGLSYASAFHMGGDEDEDEIEWISGTRGEKL